MNTRKYVSALVAAAVLALVWTGGAEAQKKQKIAILGLEVIDESGEGIDASTTDLANTITQALRERPGKMTAPFQIAPNSTKDLLEMKLLSNCSDEAESCMAGIGKELGADLLLYGKIEKLRDGYQVTLTRLDVSAKSKQALTAKLSSGEAVKKDLVDKWCTKHYIRIMGLPEEGTLVLTANVDSGTVFVDRDSKGTLVDGKARIKGLKAGKREVAVEAPGHKRYTEEVEIEIGGTVRISAQLEVGAMVRPDGPEGPTDSSPGRPGGVFRIATWGLAAAALGSGVVWGWSYKTILDNEKILEEPGVDDDSFFTVNGDDRAVNCQAVQDSSDMTGSIVRLRDACDAGEDAASLSTLGVAGTVVFGAAAIASFYLGYIASGSSSSSSERAARSKKPGETIVEVAPVVTPNYAGGAVRIEF